MSTKYSFGRISDLRVLGLMDRLFDAFVVGDATAKVGDIGEITLLREQKEDEVDSQGASIRDLLKADTFLITSMTWKLSPRSGYNLTYQRGYRVGINPNNNSEVLVRSENPFIDSIEVSASESHAPLIIEIMNDFVGMAPPISGGGGVDQALDQSHFILDRLSASIATLMEHTVDRQKDLDQTRASLSKDAEKSIAVIKSNSQEEIDRIRREFDEKSNGLNERAAQLDDRENTHVRRDFAKQMANLSDTRLSANLLARSQWSFGIPLLIALIPATLLGLLIWAEIGHISAFNSSISEITRDQILEDGKKVALIANINSQIMYAQVRMAFQSIGIAALVWFCLRMASARYSLVSGWERELHKFRLDTERAGFLVEGDLEARKVNQNGLPEVLLESFSRNLFTGADQQSAPSDEGLGSALNVLLGQAAKVRLGPDGVNVEVDGRGVKKAKRLIADAED